MTQVIVREIQKNSNHTTWTHLDKPALFIYGEVKGRSGQTYKYSETYVNGKLVSEKDMSGLKTGQLSKMHKVLSKLKGKAQ